MTEVANEAAGMRKVFGGDVMCDQPRTLFIPKPAWFFMEPQTKKQKELSEEGNGANKIERGDHQFDPGRAVSHAPLMPNLELLRTTGNPYTKDEIDAEATMQTSKKWIPFVKLSFAVFNMLTERTEGVTASEIVETAVKISGVGLNKKGEISNDAVKCVHDTMRDLRLFGLVESADASNLVKKTKFKLVANWGTVQTLKEFRAAEDAGIAEGIRSLAA